MFSQTLKLALGAGAVALVLGSSMHGAAAADSSVKRGKYLVTIMGCSDCHTPGSFLGHPDKTKFLGGSDVGFSIPGLGVFPGRNLTPDPETGLGKWTTQQVVTAFTTGRRPDGRILAPIMPYEDFKYLTKSDALAIAAYLKSLKPVKNAVPGPFGPNDTPTTFVMTVVPGQVYASMPKPPGPPPGAGGPPAGGPPPK
jgi:mono/diheme cytochrome c family protein